MLGWTLHGLFDDSSKLLVGRFRLPFYNKMFPPHLLFEQALPYIGNYMLYLRVCLAGDPILDNSDKILIENEYHMPELHVHTTAMTMSLANIEHVYLRKDDTEEAVDHMKTKPTKKKLPSESTSRVDSSQSVRKKAGATKSKFKSSAKLQSQTSIQAHSKSSKTIIHEEDDTNISF